MARVETLIAQVKTQGVQKSAQELDKLAASADKAGNELGQAGEQAKKAGPMFKQFRGASSALTNTTGQLSVQVQDVAVQLESGTDAVRVFAQQGPQIAAIFGPSGALFGAILAVGALIAGPFVRSLFAASEALDENSKKLKEYSGNLSDLSQAQRAAKLVELTQSIIETRESLEKLNEAQRDAVQRQKDMADGSDTLSGTIGRVFSGFDTLTTAQRENRNELIQNRAAIEAQVEKLEELERASQVLMGTRKEETKEIKEQADNLDTLNKRLDDQLAMLGMNNVEQKVYNALQNNATEAEAEQVRIKAKIIQAYEDSTRELAKLGAQGDQFIGTLEQQANKIDQTRSEMLRAKLETVLLNEEQRELAETYINVIEQEEKRIKTLKAQKKAMQEFIDKGREFRELVEDEARVIEEREKANKKAEDEARKERNQTIKEYDDAVLAEIKANEERERRIAEENQLRVEDRIRLEEQEAERKRQIQEQYTDGILALEDKLMKGKTEKQKLGFRALVNLSNAERRLNAGKIISDSYAAAMSAWKSLAGIPIVGPALGAAAAAGIIAGGVSYAAQSLAGRALGGQVRQGESYVVGERGPEVLTMNGGSGRIIPNDKLAVSPQVVNKNANVTFNIQANDTAGFDQLLNSRRGQIVSMINRALNDQGRQGIV